MKLFCFFQVLADSCLLFNDHMTEISNMASVMQVVDDQHNQITYHIGFIALSYKVISVQAVDQQNQMIWKKRMLVAD
jgi:hypothetical protein